MLRDETARYTLHHCPRENTKDMTEGQRGICLPLLPVHTEQSSEECFCAVYNNFVIVRI